MSVEIVYFPVFDIISSSFDINQQKFWTKREQQRYKNDDKFKSDTEHLNLKENT